MISPRTARIAMPPTVVACTSTIVCTPLLSSLSLSLSPTRRGPADEGEDTDVIAACPCPCPCCGSTMSWPIAVTSLSRSVSFVAETCTTCPSRMTTSRSVTAKISRSLCVISTQVLPDATNFRMYDSSCADACPSSEDVGSSRIISSSGCAPGVKARATSTSWRLPIGNSPATSSARKPCPGKIMSSDAISCAPARARHDHSAACGCAMRMFSASVRLSHSDSSWNTQRRPQRRASRTVQPVPMLPPSVSAPVRPAMRNSPLSGARAPHRMLTSVDLPAPL